MRSTFVNSVFGVLVTTALMSSACNVNLMAAPPSKDSTPEVKYPATIAEKDVAQYLQDISVTIRAMDETGGGGAEGSGVLKVTKDGQVWIWTCGHLVSHLRTERKNSEGKTIVEFGDAKIIKMLTENGRKVGELQFDAEVIRYSHPEHGEDLALLRVRSKQFKPAASAIFYNEKTIPPIGSKLMHCGSLLGALGSNSVTSGIISQHGRLLFSKVFDQTTCAAFPGSSGGIVCMEKDGRYVGMVVRGTGETFNLIVPVRRIKEWATLVGVGFALDDSLPVPNDITLHKLPIDESSSKPSQSNKSDDDTDDKQFTYRLLKLKTK